MEYKETIRAVMDQLVADIYQIPSSKAYIIQICDISLGTKKIISRKVRYEREGYQYQQIKNEIKDKLFCEAYNVAYT
jgi:hypothetical protein